jgi:hypothetical protein
VGFIKVSLGCLSLYRVMRVQRAGGGNDVLVVTASG